jgi:energy-coupling factor transporter ATP-binding protein EcfA2
MVILQDVKMKYPGSNGEALKGIDLTIEDGEFVFHGNRPSVGIVMKNEIMTANSDDSARTECVKESCGSGTSVAGSR